ncbi:MAG: NAD(P)/FAD-dependent oxidoreductase [Anaerolineae bacterium]
MNNYDVVIIGGGPAGSTIGCLAKKYMPQLNVLILEKEQFPRHHTGESLLAGATPVLHEMEVYDKVDSFGFPEKLGATFIWGHGREPWGFEFSEVGTHLERDGVALPKYFTKGWQVTRHDYDKLLLDHAREFGVEVKEGCRATEPLQDSNGTMIGVEYVEGSTTHRVESGWVMDCSGQDGWLANQFDLRVYDARMNNLALYGYWQDAKWKFEYVGYPNLTRIFIVSTPRGWIWYIPVRENVISVGFVTHTTLYRERELRPYEAYSEEINGCSEITELLEGAKLVRLTPDQKQDIMTIRDWSYVCRQLYGDGWAMAGDAGAFVDPVLSSGVMLAHEVGQKAAYTINSMFNLGSVARTWLWDFYQSTVLQMVKAYQEMVAFWYTYNKSMESWWWEAKRLLMSRDGVFDRQAFVLAASGYAGRLESLSLFGSYDYEEAKEICGGLFGSEWTEEPLRERYAGRPLKLHDQVEFVDGQYFFQGFVRTTDRIVNQTTGRYLDLRPAELDLIARLDGRYTLAELEAYWRTMSEENEDYALRSRQPLELVHQLNEIGVLA